MSKRSVTLSDKNVWEYRTMKPFLFRAHRKLPTIRVTARMVKVLQAMANGALDDDECELVYERGAGWWLGLERVGNTAGTRLLQACAIRAESDNRIGEFERYTINETGRQILHAARAAAREEGKTE